MRRVRRLVTTVLILALLALGALLLYGHARRHPEDMPWTELDLGRPVGAFTGRKLADLARRRRNDARPCSTGPGIRHTRLPARTGGPQCGYRHAVRFTPGGALAIAWRPSDLGTSCAVAAGLALVGMARRPARRAPPFRPARSRRSTISEAIAAAASTAATQGAWSEHATRQRGRHRRLPPRRRDAGSASSATGATRARRAASCARSATAPATCSRPCCRPNTTRRTATISTSTRRRAADGAGGGADEGELVTPTGIEPVFRRERARPRPLDEGAVKRGRDLGAGPAGVKHRPRRRPRGGARPTTPPL